MNKFCYNALLMACFTILAMFFGEWWIVLFGGIFYDWLSGESKNKDD